MWVPHLSPTTLTTDEQRSILRATAANVRDHTIISLALGTGLRLAKIDSATVTFTVDSGGSGRPRTSQQMVSPTLGPRVARHLALAHEIKRRIRSREFNDIAHAARVTPTGAKLFAVEPAS